MLVEELSACIRDALHRVQSSGAHPKLVRGLTELLAALAPHEGVDSDKFLLKITTAKRPPEKKTTDQLALEKARKAEAAALAKREKAAETARLKAEKKLRDDEAKRLAKARIEDEKIAGADRAVQALIDDLRALLMRFRGGNVPQEAVDGQLGRLNALSAPQLLRVARALNSDATLTEKSTKAKVLKQVAEMIRRVWKTSDNVNH